MKCYSIPIHESYCGHCLSSSVFDLHYFEKETNDRTWVFLRCGIEEQILFVCEMYCLVKKSSRWPLSKIIVLIKPRTNEEQQPNRRNFHDQDIAVNVLSSKVDGECCKPPIQSGKAPPCFTSSTKFSGALLSVCGQILRTFFVIPSYSDFQILVEPHRLLAVCVCVCICVCVSVYVCVWKIDTVYPLYKNDLCGNKIFPRCTVPLWAKYVCGLT